MDIVTENIFSRWSVLVQNNYTYLQDMFTLYFHAMSETSTTLLLLSYE